MNRLFACLFVLAAMSLPATADEKQDAMKKACHDDYHAFCATVMPGGGRIVACLHQHEDKLSPGCRAALAAQ
ncbi:MAG: cysteine rich repeat-containing protein [Methylovirgula sp.]